ncbi:hypothetical protein [Catellatospora paridis]|uniref:hypothetical protein n=1 Tax=Catellatospora paridis TaxID=1617086 RepID=UPI001E4BA0FC|nr:hypothetical protein [Catellatospora paridis]
MPPSVRWSSVDHDFPRCCRFGYTADGCLDNDPEVHRVLTEKVFPVQADVTTVADWTAAASAPDRG